jgi:hypothetical protein
MPKTRHGSQCPAPGRQDIQALEPHGSYSPVLSGSVPHRSPEARYSLPQSWVDERRVGRLRLLRDDPVERDRVGDRVLCATAVLAPRSTPSTKGFPRDTGCALDGSGDLASFIWSCLEVSSAATRSVAFSPRAGSLSVIFSWSSTSTCRMNQLAPPPSRHKVRGPRFFCHRKSFCEWDISRPLTFGPFGGPDPIVQ